MAWVVLVEQYLGGGEDLAHHTDPMDPLVREHLHSALNSEVENHRC